MLRGDLEAAKDRVRRLLDAAPTPPPGSLVHVIDAILPQRAALLALAAEQATPLYAYDTKGFQAALQRFKAAFDARLPGHRPFYAIKSNPHPWLLADAVRAGYGLDVSSGRELEQALAFADCPIVFSGPAKSEADLELAARHAHRVTVQLDSFRELQRLAAVTARCGVRVQAGVRVSTMHHGAWSKFGIPLADLPEFWRAAAQHVGVRLCGIQAHLSWNRDPEPYRRVLADIAQCLRLQFSAEQRRQIAFVDIGGGYRPHQLEGYFPADDPLGALLQTANDHAGIDSDFEPPYYVKPSVPLDDYAQTIGATVQEHLAPLLACAYYTEPGRIVSTWAMHIVLRVVDKKRPDLVIVDGGVNMVGWEKYLAIYAPVLNLTRPARSEIAVRLGGSLCDCEDVWGMRCFGEGIEEGDVLVVPFQGAYTLTTAQAFIRPIPDVHRLGDSAG